jgi:hypothetical protein
MILINMMMAIINLAFEEIKENSSNYQVSKNGLQVSVAQSREFFQSKFEIMEYIKRRCREIIGLSLAKPIVPVYVDEVDDSNKDEDKDEMDDTEKTSQG